jgi:hypothetical protein
MLTLGSFCKIFRNSTNHCATLKVVYPFSQEMDWAIFWATFSQTHLVTLIMILTPDTARLELD